MYFDPCLAWREKLSADDKETVLTLADVMASAHKDAACMCARGNYRAIIRLIDSAA